MAVGLLSALPCIVFALVGVLAVPLSKRFGLTCVVTVAMAVTTFGLGVRPFVSNFWAFLLLSVAGLAGPAVGNVIVPAWIKLHKAGRTVLLLTVYGGVLPLGGAMGSFLGAPIAGPDSSGWRTALFIWAPWALLAVLVWLLAWKSVGRDTPPVAQSLAPVPESSTPLTGDEATQSSSPSATNRRSLMTSPTAVALMGCVRTSIFECLRSIWSASNDSHNGGSRPNKRSRDGRSHQPVGTCRWLDYAEDR